MRLNLLKVLNENFRIQIFFSFALLIFVMCVSFTFLIIHRQTESLTDALIKKGNLLAGVLAYNSRIGVFSENKELLEVITEGILRQEGVLEVSIFNVEKKLLNRKERPEVRSLEKSSRMDEESRRKRMEQIRETGLPSFLVGNSVVEFWSPVISDLDSYKEASLFFKEDQLQRKTQIIGFTMIMADKRLLNKEINDLLFKTIFIGIAFLIIGFVVTYMMVKGITKPLNKLIESVKIFGTAGSVEKIPIETEDEIGKLAMAFNNMAESLKKREMALRESEEKYRVLASTSDLMFLVNRDCQYLFLNDAYMRRLGLAKEQVIGRNFSDFHNETSSDEFRDCIRRVCETGHGQPYTHEYLSARDGRYFLQTFSSSLDTTHGEAIAVTVSSKDITELKRSEEAIKALGGYLNQIINRIGDPIFVKDQQHGFVLVNEALCAFLGKTREELIGTTGYGNLPRVGMEVFWKQDNLVLETGVENIDEENFTDAEDKVHTIITKKTRYIDHDGNKQLIGVIRDITERKQAEEYLKQSFLHIRRALGATIHAIAATVETRDPYTAGHQRRVADIARSIATMMDLTTDQIDGIRMAATIHDLGKISVPAEILSKPTKLTKIEFSLIKVHPQSGYDILKDIEFPWPIARMVLEHHERMDGSGYPNGLTGDALLLESRILMVADVVEAMASHRPYRPALGIDIALEEINKNKGALYDTEAVDACLRIFHEKNYKMVQ